MILIPNAIDYIGQIVTVSIDRPKGSRHPKYPEQIYLINYGFVPNTLSGDGEELDAYILGVEEPLENFVGECIAVIRRTTDQDDKLIVVPRGVTLSDEEIKTATWFQERHFEGTILR